MRQQQLENYLNQIEGIVTASLQSGNYVTSLLQIMGVINQSKRKYVGVYEEATAEQQQASLKRKRNWFGY